MIYQKGEYWAIRGHPNKYTSYEDVKAAYIKMKEKEAAKAAKIAAALLQEALQEEKYRAEVKERLGLEATPFEIMIEKKICTICDLEPCECFTFTKKTELGP